MPIIVEKQDSLESVRVEGEMTIYTASKLKDELFMALRDTPTADIDLSQVSEFDSAGLQILVLLHREASRSNQQLTLTASSPAVQDLLQVFGMEGFFGESTYGND